MVDLYLLLSTGRTSGGMPGPVLGTVLLKRYGVFGERQDRSNIIVQRTGKMGIAEQKVA